MQWKAKSPSTEQVNALCASQLKMFIFLLDAENDINLHYRFANIRALEAIDDDL